MILTRYKHILIKVLIILFFLLMFFFPYASYQGASSGLLLWFLNVLPTLLPFVIISNLMIRLNIAGQISRFLYPLFGRILRLSPNGCYPLLVGFLSGIPMGAKSSADLVSEQSIDREEGNFLLTLCNNASPIFIMNYIAMNQLKLPRIRLPLFVIIYSSSIVSALLFRSIKRISRLHKNQVMEKTNKIHPKTDTNYESVRFSFDIMDNSIMNGFEVVTKIGGYIILFSILAQIINQISPGIGILKASFMGILEITTGINQICSIHIENDIKIVLTAVIASFGGLSGLAQTKSVLGNSRLSIKSYCIVKLLSALIAFVFSVFYVSFLQP